jgi:hypothetical protein
MRPVIEEEARSRQALRNMGCSSLERPAKETAMYRTNREDLAPPRSHEILRRVIPAALSVLAGCTVFDGLSVPEGGGSGAGGAGGATSGGSGVLAGSGGGTSGSGGIEAPLEYLSLENGARLCARISACPLVADTIVASIGMPADVINFSQCMTWVSGPIAPDRPGFALQQSMLTCMVNAPSCEEAAYCGFVVKLVPGLPICDNGNTCVGAEAAADCLKGVAYFCKTAGFDANSACVKDGEVVKCSLGDCAAPGTSVCSGEALHRCDMESRLRPFFCPAWGLVCSDVNGAPACATQAGTSTPCTTLGASSCAASGAAVVCTGDLESGWDCAAVGGACAGPSGSVRCAGPKDACSPFDVGVNECISGGQGIAICVGGSKVEVDCSAIGLSCQPADASKTAHCG